jgi:hypothetical protein
LEWLRPAGLLTFDELSLLKEGLIGVAVGLIESLLIYFADLPIVMSSPRTAARSRFMF